jgi:hypothetical protein
VFGLVLSMRLISRSPPPFKELDCVKSISLRYIYAGQLMWHGLEYCKNQVFILQITHHTQLIYIALIKTQHTYLIVGLINVDI